MFGSQAYASKKTKIRSLAWLMSTMIHLNSSTKPHFRLKPDLLELHIAIAMM